MNMKGLIITLAMLPLMCYAQFEASMFTTNNQKLIEQAVQSGFTIVEQTYQLEDSTTHQRFGRYGNKIFGRARALGVRVADDVLVDKKILFPWENDANFNRYRTSHIPVISSATLIELNDTTRTEIVLNENSISNATKSLIAASDSASVIKGFKIEVFEQSTDGWLVWITSDKTIAEWDESLTHPLIYKKTIDFTPDNNEYEVDAPQTSNHLWGGVFIIPQQTEIGQLTFKLGGILVQAHDNNWALETLVPQEEEIIQQGDELTPLDTQPIIKKRK